MIYSVWRDGHYDYYTAPGKADPERAPAVRGASKIGATPEQASWRLPLGARYTGRGEVARGHVATGAFDFAGPNFLLIGLLGLSGYLIWKHVL